MQATCGESAPPHRRRVQKAVQRSGDGGNAKLDARRAGHGLRYANRAAPASEWLWLIAASLFVAGGLASVYAAKTQSWRRASAWST